MGLTLDSTCRIIFNQEKNLQNVTSDTGPKWVPPSKVMVFKVFNRTKYLSIDKNLNEDQVESKPGQTGNHERSEKAQALKWSEESYWGA